MRRMFVAAVGFAFLAAACPGGDDDATIERSPSVAPTTRPTPSPTPVPEIRFEMSGEVVTVLPPSTFDAESLEEAASATPEPSPTGSPRATASPTPSPTPEGDDERKLGGLVIEIEDQTAALAGCGFEAGDDVVVLFPGVLVTEPETLSTDARFPGNLDGKTVTVLGEITEQADQCLLVGDTLRQGGAEIGRTPAPTSGTTRRSTPRPTTAPTRRPTSSPTGSPAPTATATPASTPAGSPTSSPS